MNSVIDKLGLYDLFGVLLSGIIMEIGIIVLGVYGIYDMSIFNFIEGDTTLKIVVFVIGGYLLGIIIQEIASFLDKKIFKYRSNATSHFLNSSIIKNSLELQDFKEMAKDILKKNKGNNYDEGKEQYVFQYCKTYLEVNNKNTKAERINSLYAMSRSLSFIAFLFSCVCLFIMKWSLEKFIISSLLIIIGLLFLHRTKKYAAYRVRVVLRQYKMLNENDR